MFSITPKIYQPRYVHPSQAGQLQQMSQYPGTQMYMQLPQSMAVGPMGHNVPMAYYPMGAMYPPGSTVLVEGGYDAGARFGQSNSASIPVSIRKTPCLYQGCQAQFLVGGVFAGFCCFLSVCVYLRLRQPREGKVIDNHNKYKGGAKYIACVVD